ncbi:amino acid ABC transporter substrate-binding protein [Microcoleus sp. FACHB-SPT15]|uniref:ABC transporter substrate-binding protein n=1 Tax=Microcoleus sp. FACHB-SPT15 TaxID=2692830 RepID=UPI001780C388|nr:ABC transporter substrate-binding protein [Microcoleus sp. FACHB-SPT15]MBD1808704.1 amino acid ABC transporter substrate-binding protein [Microcoleus sp. FACHB-SPT15]
MSQKNETVVLLLSLLVTVALVATGLWWFTNRGGINLGGLTGSDNSGSTTSAGRTSNQPVEARISLGDKLLFSSGETPEKQAAVEAIASSNYEAAVSNLEAALKSDRNDPEALIYLNNARIGNRKSYAIAASIPIGTAQNPSKEVLRGVAQAQNEVNQAGGIGGVPLKVIIANDDNDPNVAQQVAEALVENQQVLGVVGNFDSDVTLAAGKVYEKGQLVQISPTSTSVQLSNAGEYIFRTVPSDRFAGNALSRYMLTQLKKQKAAVFFNSKSNYSQSLKNEFSTTLLGDGGEVVAEFDFSSPNFDVASSVQEAIGQGAEVLMLAPNTAALDQALQVVQVNEKRLPVLAGDSGYSFKTLEVGRSNAVGMVLAVPWHILGNPEAEFPKAANQLWGAEINWRTAMAYDATKALIAGIEQNPTRTGVQQALSASNFSATGAANPIRFLPSGDRNQVVQLVTIQPVNNKDPGYEFIPVRE